MFLSFSESCEYSNCCFPSSRKKEKYRSRSVYEYEVPPTSSSLIHPRPIIDQLYFPPVRYLPHLPRARLIDYLQPYGELPYFGGVPLPFILQPPQAAVLPPRVPLILPPVPTIPLRIPGAEAAIRTAVAVEAIRAATVRAYR